MALSPVKALFNRFWDWRLKEFPEFATFIGDHSYDDKLQSYTIESFQSRKITVGTFLEEASQLLLNSNLEDEDKINLEYFICDLNIFMKGMNAKGYFFPISYLDGVHIEFERLIDVMKKESESDYLNIVERLSLLPCQISEIIQTMRGGIENKMTFHSISVIGIIKQLDLLQLEPEETVFFKPFATIPDDITFSTNSKAEILSKAKTIISENVLPAFKKLKSFLENEYFKHLRPEIAISSLNKGKEFYQMCLDFHLSCTMTPEEIHETGVKEVERIKKKMDAIIESLELNMSQKEFSQHMRKQTAFSFQSVEELLEAYRGVVFNSIEPKIPELFNFLPKSKLLIKTIPSSSPNAPAAYYYAGTFDGSKPGTFLINATDLKASPKYDVMTLALHETMPGHHLQASYLIESENIPKFRQFLEDRRYTEAPSLFPLYTAYVEGWGLYSEHLGYELGLYDDVYLEYGHLSYEMFRACRLVVDTGIHVFGWTRDQAIDFLLQHTALHESDLENEVDRYITWPGQACAYKIGEIRIQALRERAEKALGSKFDVREFHDVILKGFGPLHLLEQRVVEYIERCSS